MKIILWKGVRSRNFGREFSVESEIKRQIRKIINPQAKERILLFCFSEDLFDLSSNKSIETELAYLSRVLANSSDLESNSSEKLYIIVDEFQIQEGKTPRVDKQIIRKIKNYFEKGEIILVKKEEGSDELQEVSRFTFKVNILKKGFRIVKEFMVPILMEIFTGNEESKRSFLDYFLGLPGALTDDEGNKIQLNLLGKIMSWTTYCLGGFILKPLQNIAKCIFEIPAYTMAIGLFSLCDWLEKKIRLNKNRKHRRRIARLADIIITFLTFAIIFPICMLVNSILSPIDNIKNMLSFEIKLNKVLAGISAITTTLFYSSLIVLTAGFILPFIAPTVIVPVLSTVANTIIGGLASLFGSFTGAVATAITVTGLPLIALTSNGTRILVEKNLKKEEAKVVKELVRSTSSMRLFFEKKQARPIGAKISSMLNQVDLDQREREGHPCLKRKTSFIDSTDSKVIQGLCLDQPGVSRRSIEEKISGEVSSSQNGYPIGEKSGGLTHRPD